MSRLPKNLSNSNDFAKRPMAVIAISDSNYASRCATLIESASIQDFTTVLALDSGVFALEKHFTNLKVTKFDEFLSDHSEIASRIQGRSFAEKIFSVGPSFLLLQAHNVVKNGWLIYADSDLFFFQPLWEYLQELPSCNVVIAPHRHYFWNQQRLAKYGEFNVGLVAFKNNVEGLRALRYWADSCLNWCFDKAEDGKYADQKYLEDFASVASGVYVEKSGGANLAPWNSDLSRISVDNKGNIFVNKERLVYFHAQGIKHVNGRWVLGHINYLSFASRQLKKLIYAAYFRKLETWSKRLRTGSFGSARVPSKLFVRLKNWLIISLSLVCGQTVKLEMQRKGKEL